MPSLILIFYKNSSIKMNGQHDFSISTNNISDYSQIYLQK